MWARNQLVGQDSRYILRDARDFALVNGLLLRNKFVANDNCVIHLPVTLFPSPFPSELYKKCLENQPIVNKLMLKIANDHEFLEEALGTVVQADDFTRNLLKINKIVQKEGQAQSIISCINRADYMLDRNGCEDSRNGLRVRQVEMNAISSSMSAHSFNTNLLHQYLMTKYHIKKPNGPSFTTSFPENKSLALISEGLIDAFDAYGNTSAFILVVCEDRSLNFSDHIRIELEVHKSRPDIKIVRRRFIDLPGKVKLGPNKELILEESSEIALVYYRYCYDPSAYNFPEAWDVRLLLERSRAIKCPSINFHLSGAKKFQQVLNTQKQLERFLQANEAKELEQTFCKIWNLESSKVDEQGGLEIGLESSRNLVLKPQREGGGHNIFGKDVEPFLRKLGQSDEKLQYILMEYIDSPLERNWLLLQDDSNDFTRLDEECDQLVSELGIYGSILADDTGIKCNKSAGYLIRSKRFGVNEGGVAAGYAGISSLILLTCGENDMDSSLFYAN